MIGVGGQAASRRTDAVVSATLVVLLGAVLGPAAGNAFHDGGVASCSACHTMHNSQDGQAVDPDNPGGNPRLLTAATPSDVCLSCHAEALGAVFGADPLAPPPERGGGNFVFLLEDNLNDGADGAIDPISGDAAGHNIDAPSRGVSTDGTNIHSPGGNYPSRRLGCTSCHDPHGNRSFRFLIGVGDGTGWGNSTRYPAPLAEGISLVAGSETDANHTAYQHGVSRWCGNCHEGYLFNHYTRDSDFSHLSDGTLSATVVENYNLYNGTSDPLGGDIMTAYLAAVPFEDKGTNIDGTAGPGGVSRITCLSCHRAHASSAPRSGRWDFNVPLLVEDGVVSGSYPIPNPYQDISQGPLCEKCHIWR